MLARPEVTCCCAHENSRKGSAQKVTASTVRLNQTRSRVGRCSRRMRTMSPRVSPPSTSRDQTTCEGESPVSPTFMNRKLEPQMRPTRTNCTATATVLGRDAAATDRG